MSSVICGRPCPFNKGMYCGKDIVLLNQFGQCDEHWGRAGNPIIMRDLTVENIDEYLKRQSEKIGKDVETDETKEEKSENDAEIGEGSPTYDKENGGEPKDDIE